MFEILKAILFGIVEGVTEWLPISSTGHLILLNQFVKLSVSDEFYSMFEVVIQLGAILAVIVLFFQRLNPFSPKKSPAQKRATWDLWAEGHRGHPPPPAFWAFCWTTGWTHIFIITSPWPSPSIAYGAAFILVERSHANKKPAIEKVGKIDYKTALLIGCFQCLSLIPGTSRSGLHHPGGNSSGSQPSGGSGVLLLHGHPHHGRGQRPESPEIHQGRHCHDRQRDHDSHCGLRGQLPGEPCSSSAA